MYYEDVVAGLQCQIDANKVQSLNQVESGSVIDKENV